MTDIKHTSYRFNAVIRSKLRTLAAVDGTNQTETLKRLINAEYRARQDEIREFRKSQKSKQ